MKKIVLKKKKIGEPNPPLPSNWTFLFYASIILITQFVIVYNLIYKVKYQSVVLKKKCMKLNNASVCIYISNFKPKL